MNHTSASWFVYMVRCSDGTLYTGATTDVKRRVLAHNTGRGARYTRSRLPVSLVYLEEAQDRSDALRREAAIKRFHRPDKEDLVCEFLSKQRTFLKRF